MYDYFVGTIVEQGPMHCVLEVGPGPGRIGYHFTVSVPCAESLETGREAKIFAHLQVRDIEHRLFGFLSREERSMFQLLLTVSGVGPGLAIKILSGCPHRDLRGVIQREDLARLRKVRGIGAKTAQRILVDLRDTVAGMADDHAGTPDAVPDERPAESQAFEDALLALLALGYPRPSAEKALRKAREEAGGDETSSPDAWVRRALRRL